MNYLKIQLYIITNIQKRILIIIDNKKKPSEIIYNRFGKRNINNMGCSGMKGLCTNADTEDKKKPEDKQKPKKERRGSSDSGSSHGSGHHGRGRGHHKGGPGGPGPHGGEGHHGEPHH